MACHARGHSELVKWRPVAVAKRQRFIRTIHQGSLVYSAKCFTSKTAYFLFTSLPKLCVWLNTFIYFLLCQNVSKIANRNFSVSQKGFSFVHQRQLGALYADKMVHQMYWHPFCPFLLVLSAACHQIGISSSTQKSRQSDVLINYKSAICDPNSRVA